MNDRFRFRATFPVSYYDENGNDKDIKLTVYDVAVYSGGEIGFTAQQMETVINALKLPEIEEDTMWQFINDNYATSSYEWFVCDNAIVEQCTGLSDKNGNLIYEGDVIHDLGEIEPICSLPLIVRWGDRTARFYLDHQKIGMRASLGQIDSADSHNYEIIGNIHTRNKK